MQKKNGVAIDYASDWVTLSFSNGQQILMQIIEDAKPELSRRFIAELRQKFGDEFIDDWLILNNADIKDHVNLCDNFEDYVTEFRKILGELSSKRFLMYFLHVININDKIVGGFYQSNHKSLARQTGGLLMNVLYISELDGVICKIVQDGGQNFCIIGERRFLINNRFSKEEKSLDFLLECIIEAYYKKYVADKELEGISFD